MTTWTVNYFTMQGITAMTLYRSGKMNTPTPKAEVRETLEKLVKEYADNEQGYNDAWAVVSKHEGGSHEVKAIININK